MLRHYVDGFTEHLALEAIISAHTSTVAVTATFMIQARSFGGTPNASKQSTQSASCRDPLTPAVKQSVLPFHVAPNLASTLASSSAYCAVFLYLTTSL